MNKRDKIIEIVMEAKWRDMFGDHHGICEHIAKAIANSLIANGIGDVAAWKKRAEVAERNDKIKDRALKIAATRLKCYGGWGKGFCAVSDCEYRNCGNDEGCVLAHLRKAEREIEEERK